MAEYELQGKYSPRPLMRRFRAGATCLRACWSMSKKEGLENEWEDVLEIVGAEVKAERNSHRRWSRGNDADDAQVMHDRPIYGKPMFGPFSFAPTNEQGVLFVFGGVAHELGLTSHGCKQGFRTWKQ